MGKVKAKTPKYSDVSEGQHFKITPNAVRLRPLKNKIVLELASFSIGSEEIDKSICVNLDYEMFKLLSNQIIVDGIEMQKKIDADIGFKEFLEQQAEEESEKNNQ